MSQRTAEERIIRPGNQSAFEGLAELFAYRELILTMAWKNYTVRYKQTILGVAWAFLKPLLTALAMMLAFGHILGVQTDGLPSLLFYLCNTALWTFFGETVRTNSRMFVDNAYLFGKVYFPRLVMPLSNLLLSLVTFGIQMLLMIILILFYWANGSMTVNFLMWLPALLVVLLTGILGMSLGVAVSSLTTRYRDLAMLVDFAIQLWMYLTPVVYPLSQIRNPVFRKLLLLNPTTSLMESFRMFFLGKGTLVPAGLIWSTVFTLAAALAAVNLFFRIETSFMDTV